MPTFLVENWALNSQWNKIQPAHRPTPRNLKVGSEKRREDFERRLQLNEEHLQAVPTMKRGEVPMTGWKLLP